MKQKGNPFKRGNTWTFIYYVYDEKGKRHQKWKGGYATREEAIKELEICKAKAKLNQIFISSDETLEHFLNRWFAIHKLTLQPSTINGYNGIIQKHIIPALGKVKLKNLKQTEVQRFYCMLLEDKELSPKTVLYVHNVLKTALKSAVDEKLIEENVCLKVKPPKVPKYKSALLSKEQMNILLSYLKGKRYETEIYLAVMLGLRRGEVLGLMYSDVDFERHTISIQRQVSTTKDDTKNNTEYYGIKKLKSESSNRVLYISEDIEGIIRQKIMYNESQKRILGQDYHDSGLICCGDDGSIMSPQTLYHAFKRILKECELPDVRFHDLRHSYATLCIDLNVPIKVLSQSLGHSSIAVTDSVYADSIRAKQELANMIGDAINLDTNHE